MAYWSDKQTSNHCNAVGKAEEGEEWKQFCEVLILFLSPLLSLVMHVKSLYDSLEISVTHDYPSQLCSGIVHDDNGAKTLQSTAAITTE